MELAMKEFEWKKGALLAIVEKGIDLVDAQVKHDIAHQKLLDLARNAKNIGVGKFNRSEFYDRKVFSWFKYYCLSYWYCWWIKT